MRPVRRALLPLLLLFSLAGACRPEPPAPQEPPPAPGFALTSLEGDVVSLEALSGRPVVIHFGASWCPFCRAEDPHLQALQQEYAGRGVQVLVINVGEADSVAARWKKEAGFSFPMLLDRDGAVAASYAPPEAQPDLPRHEVMVASNLIVGPKGRLRYLSLLDTRTFDARLTDLRKRLDDVLSEG